MFIPAVNEVTLTTNIFKGGIAHGGTPSNPDLPTTSNSSIAYGN